MVSWAIAPRPVAWVTSVDSDGKRNLAPFSFFTIASTDPLILMIAIEPREDDSRKDTLCNVLATGSFVIHIADVAQVAAVARSGELDSPDVDELAVLELATRHGAISLLPVIEGCIAVFECELSHTLQPGRETLVFGRVLAARIAEDVFDEAGRIDGAALRPVGRIGNTFAAINLIDIAAIRN